jgi:hypothetical protein
MLICPCPVQTVYLSKNSLQSTDGIRQFQAVGTLSLADNLLSDLDTVRVKVAV